MLLLFFCLHAILLDCPLLSLLVFACYPLCHPPCVCMLPSVIYLVFACYPLGLCLHATLFLVTVGIHLKWSLLGLCNSRDVLLKIGFHIEIVLTCASPRKNVHLLHLAYPRSVDFTLPQQCLGTNHWSAFLAFFGSRS